MIKHKFRLVIKGVNLGKSMSFKEISERFSNTILDQTSDGNFEITISKTESRRIEITKREAYIEATELVDRLSLINNHDIKELRYLGYEKDETEFVKEKADLKAKVSMIGRIEDPKSFYSKPNNLKIFNKIIKYIFFSIILPFIYK